MSIVETIALAFPKRVQCNVCRWQGRKFVSDGWHEQIVCPHCRSSLRHRLMLCALQHIDNLSQDTLIKGKRVLHFAPAPSVRPIIKGLASHYASSDFLRPGFDLKLDMSAMTDVVDGSYDLVIALDVLEHVPDFRRAIEETHRILSPGGWAIFMVPQKDGLAETHEDLSITTPEDRTRIFGQADHLRILGSDFPRIVQSKGFQVVEVKASDIETERVRKHVLFPPVLSSHPLATNHRTVFFACKPGGR